MKTKNQHMLRLASLALGASLMLAACGPKNDGGEPTPTPVDLNCDELSDPLSQQACNDYPRVIDLQQGLMTETCSPNPGVCHQTNNYPDMHSAGNFLSVVDAPCNVEIPDPTQGWDNCELPADVMQTSSGFTSDVAWIENVGTGTYDVSFAVAPTVTQTEDISMITDATGQTVLLGIPEFMLTVDLVAGVNEATIHIGAQDFFFDYVDSILATVIGGDSNRNGTYGADAGLDYAALVVPGDLDNSYLWGRITGTVPGSRMPLANGPVTNPQYIALACWIEGLTSVSEAPQPTDYIDYQACNFAADPIDYEIEDF